MNGRKRVTRAMFIRELVKTAEKYKFRTLDAENKQEIVEKAQEIGFSDLNLAEIRNRNTRVLVEGHLVDDSWRRTQASIQSLPEGENEHY